MSRHPRDERAGDAVLAEFRLDKNILKEDHRGRSIR